MRRPRLARGLLGLAVLLLLLPACGRRAAPVPPRPLAPAAPGSLRAQVEDGAIVVSWARPTRNEDGSSLSDLQAFRLYRAVGQRPPTSFSLLATVRAEQPENATVVGDLYAFRDDGGPRGLTPGTRYTYRVQALDSRGTAGPPSVEVALEFFHPPPAPTDLSAVGRSGLVDLSWREPGPSPPGGAPVRGYNVYRRTQTGRYGSQPVNGRLIHETHYQDIGLENDATYSYVVRSVGSEQPPWLESADSNEATVTPIDVTPPAPPQGLVAVPGPGSISLSWQPNVEPDLLGYLVYRREPPATVAVRLTPDPIPATTFPDRTARPGVPYTYWVTAVDRSSRRNESAPSAEVTAAIP